MELNNTLKHTIEECRQFAESKGGKCLSKEYKNCREGLMWECNKKHQWKARLSSILSGAWCKKCYLERVSYTIKDAQNIAQERNGLCLSSAITNFESKLDWKCNICGNIWAMTLHCVLQNQWCPKCQWKKANEKKYGYTIQDLQKFATKRGGECLSTEYHGINHKYKWKCKESHTWTATIDSILHGSWCRVCSDKHYVGETICRYIMEQMFNKPFLKSYPKWNKSKKGGQMELDGYNKEIGIAFEYNGKQHYYQSSFLPVDLNDQKIRDTEKERLCNIHGVILLKIPYNVKYDKMQDFITNLCNEHSISIPNTSKISFTDAPLINNDEIIMLKLYAEAKNGQLLSTKYIDRHTHLLWKCNACGNEWRSTPNNVVNMGRWCPKCGIKKMLITRMHNIK